MPLFQNEPDEPEGPSLFQNEGDEVALFCFQDEPDEPVVALPVQPPSLPSGQAQLFQDELDGPVSESDSDSSGHLADYEDEPKTSTQKVNLNFAALTKFLDSQLCRAGQKEHAEPVKKKRKYNNAKRAAKAAAAKQLPENEPATTRLARNSLDS